MRLERCFPACLDEREITSKPVARQVDWMFVQPDMLDQMHDAVITTDLHGIVTGCNRAVSTIYAFNPEELVGQSVTVLYGEEDRRHF